MLIASDWCVCSFCGCRLLSAVLCGVAVQDDGSWPVPPIESQAKSFNPKMMEGQWYISAGLNPAFDTFDCQVIFAIHGAPGVCMHDEMKP